MKHKKLLLLTTFLLSLSLAGCGGIPNAPSRPDGSQITEGISLNFDSYSVYVGKKFSLTVSGTSQTVTWTSSDTSVATVSEGIVTGVKVGTATITAKVGSYSASCAVTVVENTSTDTYVPDKNDPTIFFITNDTLSQATFDSSKVEYTYNVSSNYKQIYVDVPDLTVVAELNGVTIENSLNSPIYVKQCDKLELSAKKDTVNYIKDTRMAYTEDDSSQGKGAIYVIDGDFKLKGQGTLNIQAGYYNGVHVKDDVKIQKQTLNITAVNHGIKGNDSITVDSGNINITCGGDGLHTENSDISNKGNQKGNVTISGGTVNINSWGDAVQAAYNAVIEEADNTVPTVLTAKTNKYSSYTGETVTTNESSFYLKLNSSTYANGSYTYAALINGQWYKATDKGQISSQGNPGDPGGRGGRPGGSTSYVYEISKPKDATSFTLYRYQGNNVTSFSETNYNAKSDAKAFNTAYDMVSVSVSGGNITFGSWSNYSSSSNSNSADVSAKGIKAENEIYISAGTINIEAYDDAIHANNDGTIENGSTPLGNVNISGGNLTLKASDDGVHADNILNISGGKTNVTTAYEGLEGNVIKVSGGETYVIATDDGVNATKGKASPSVEVSGGLLDVTVSSNGDTDGIDSNGTYKQSGGTVIVKGPGSASGSGGGGSFALDTDGAVTLSSGTLIVFGGIEQKLSTSLTKTLCSSTTVKAGEHTVSFSSASYKTTLKYDANGCIVYSSLGTATLK